MAASAARSVDIILNGIDQTKGATASAESNLRRLTNTVKVSAASVGIYFGARQIVSGIGSIISAASDAEEAASKFGVTFGQSADETGTKLDDFAGKAGRSRFELRSMAADFGALIKPMGLTEDAAGDMSAELSKLATDLASFFNTTDAEALTALRAGLVGESEPLRKYGVQLSAARIEQEAFALGLASTKSELTTAHKAQAAFNLIMRDTSEAQGDAVRTSGSYANQVKALKAEFHDLSTEIGTAFLPVATKTVNVLRSLVGVNAETTVKTIAVTAAFSGTLLVLPKLISFVKSLTTTLKGLAKAEAIAQAFGGPAGWATLAASVTVAASAFVAIDSAFADVERSSQRAAIGIDSVTTATDGMTKSLQRAEATRERVLGFIKTTFAEKDAAEKSGADTLKKLLEQTFERADSAGKTPDQILLDKIKSLSGGNNTTAFLTAKFNLELAEMRQGFEDVAKRGEQLAGMFRDPVIQFREDIEALDAAFARGLITAQELANARNNLQQQLEDEQNKRRDERGTNRPPQPNAAVAGRTITGLAQSQQTQNTALVLQRKQAGSLEDINRTSNKTYDAIRALVDRLGNSQSLVVGSLKR